jgi:hypothetical protein
MTTMRLTVAMLLITVTNSTFFQQANHEAIKPLTTRLIIVLKCLLTRRNEDYYLHKLLIINTKMGLVGRRELATRKR